MRTAYLFPGQGSQRVGMGVGLAANDASAAALFGEASDVLGYDLLGLCRDGPAELLGQTLHAQPALYVTSCAAHAALARRAASAPVAMAGHSVGEYAALACAGAVSFAAGLRLVKRRAELMQEAAERSPGAMAAVLGLEAGVVRAACAEARGVGVVGVANYNGPGQIVVSGEVAAVEAASEIAVRLGARRVVRLPVSGGFHSALMASAGDALYPDLRDAGFREPATRVVMNVSAEYLRAAVDIAPQLTMQVSGSVLWEQSMRLLLADGVTRFVELGTGDVLTGLMKRIDRGATAIAVGDAASVDDAAAAPGEPGGPA
ncbi:MAG: ACP S-malonyltransferase [Chthonomonadales bacterium]|nr:ACP S-malonyltransferase [Chthonomonadales bacterium]